tara:strand:+ start:1061 stop:1396 length:336 start_codon:yes stop_codon:yes gene_type:complete
MVKEIDMASNYQIHSRKFYNAYYSQLVGATITKFELVKEDFEGKLLPTFEAKKGKDIFYLTLSMDEEGNGPGFMFGLQHPSEKQIEAAPATIYKEEVDKEGNVINVTVIKD